MIKYILILISFFATSCTIISDEDGDGESDGNRFITNFYSDQRNYSLYATLITADKGSGTEQWYTSDNPLQFELVGDFPYRKLNIFKDGVLYEQAFNKNNQTISSTNNARHLFQIKSGIDTGKYVIISTEPSPVLEEDFFFLLISKTIYTTTGSAVNDLNSETLNVPKLEAVVPMIDLVFDPNDFVVEYKNKTQHLNAIKSKYDVLEFFGDDLINNKKSKLEKLDYNIPL